MNDSSLHFTLRKTQAHFTDRRVLAGLIIFGLAIGLVGPFDTYSALSTLPRLAYWLAISFLSYGAGFAMTTALLTLLRERALPIWLCVAIGGLFAGLPIALLIYVINGLTFGFEQIGVPGLIALLVNTPLISLAITTLSVLAAKSGPEENVTPAAAPSLLQRLPLAQRGRLLHLTVADHYVEVSTDRGKTLLLMRFADAIGEAKPIAGLQVHRSHWVALAAVRRSFRQNGKAMLELENGAIIPISRSYQAEARKAGLC